MHAGVYFINGSALPRQGAITLLNVTVNHLGLKGLSGLGYIAGDAAIDGDPADPDVPDTAVQSLIRLYRDSDGALVKTIVSHPVTGAWRFEDINEEFTYTAVAYLKNYRAVIADGVKPKRMT